MSQKYIFGRVSRGRARAAKFILTECALFFALILMQTTFFARFRIFGAIPDLCLGALILIAYFCGKETGAVTGIAVGFAADALGSVGISVLPVFYLLVGYLCGYFTRAVTPKRLYHFLLLLAASLPARAILTAILTILSHRGVAPLHLIFKVLLPEAAATAIFSLVLYIPIKRLSAWLIK